MISELGEKHGQKDLLAWIQPLRQHLRTHASDLFSNATTWEIAWNFLKNLDHTRACPAGLSDNAATSPTRENDVAAVGKKVSLSSALQQNKARQTLVDTGAPTATMRSVETSTGSETFRTSSSRTFIQELSTNFNESNLASTNDGRSVTAVKRRSSNSLPSTPTTKRRKSSPSNDAVALETPFSPNSAGFSLRSQLRDWAAPQPSNSLAPLLLSPVGRSAEQIARFDHTEPPVNMTETVPSVPSKLPSIEIRQEERTRGIQSQIPFTLGPVSADPAVQVGSGLRAASSQHQTVQTRVYQVDGEVLAPRPPHSTSPALAPSNSLRERLLARKSQHERGRRNTNIGVPQSPSKDMNRMAGAVELSPSGVAGLPQVSKISKLSSPSLKESTVLEARQTYSGEDFAEVVSVTLVSDVSSTVGHAEQARFPGQDAAKTTTKQPSRADRNDTTLPERKGRSAALYGIFERRRAARLEKKAKLAAEVGNTNDKAGSLTSGADFAGSPD